MPLQAVLLDIDGTLLDSVDFHATAWQEAFAQFGKQLDFQAIRGQIGKGGDQLLPVFLDQAERDSFGKELEQARGRIFQEKYLPRVQPFPQVRELCERLRQDGIKIALASSAKAEELDIYKKIARIEDLLQAEASSKDADRSKPHPDIFAAALDHVGAKAADAVAIGDTPYDAIAAGKLGLRTYGVLCGGFPEDELRRGGCRDIYQDPADLLSRYTEWAV